MKSYNSKRRKDLRGRMQFLFVAILISINILLIAGIQIYDRQTEYFYDFENDVVDSFPKGFVGVGRINTTKVVEWNVDDGHKGKVVQIAYLEENPYDYAGTELNTLFTKSTEGIISFDIYLKCFLSVAIDICQEDMVWNKTDDICIRMPQWDYVEVISVRNELGRIENITNSLELLQWYHFIIYYNCIRNNWNVVVYDEDMKMFGEGGFDFSVQPSYMCQLYFATYKLSNEFYIDNVRISLNNIII